MSKPTTRPDRPVVRDELAAFRERPLLEQVLTAAITVLGIALTVSTLYFAWERPITRTRFAVAFFGVGLALYYLSQVRSILEDPTAESARARWNDWMSDRQFGSLRRADAVVCLVLAVTAAATSYHVYTDFFRLSEDAIVFGFEVVDLYVGLVIVALTIDATRRAYGWSIAMVALGSVLYAYYGPLLPGFLNHPGFSLANVATYGAVRISGAFSFIMRVGATWVAVFIMFAGLAQAYGALDFILGLGQKLGERLRSGVVHVAVISSMAMGSITGSAAANTATTGSFTIPMMKRQGVRADFAAAIESVASSGGQIMPPVMGVAAFLMADIIGVSYVRIIQAAVIPAVLFYFSVGVAVQFVVLRNGWTTERTAGAGVVETLFSRDVLVKVAYLLLFAGSFVVARQVFALGLFASAGAVAATLLAVRLLQALASSRDEPVPAQMTASLAGFFDGAHFGVPMAVLLYTLVVMELSPMSAGLYTTLTMVGTMFVRDLVVHGPDREGDASGASTARSAAVTVGRTLYTTLKGFRRGALDMAPLVGVLASMGVIIAMVTQTGLTGKISTQMVALGGGVLVVVLLLAMVTSILFGLGMPTPAAYILVATLLTGPLVDLGVTRITAHLFVFYFAMLSAITPPVAVGVAVGSRIANSGFMLSAKQALRIGAAGFLIPFALVVNDSLVNWTLTGTPVAVYCVFVGVIALTVVTIGYDGRHVLGAPHRSAYLALSLSALYAPALSVALGAGTTTLLQVGGATVALTALGLTHVGRLPRAIAPRPTPDSPEPDD